MHKIYNVTININKLWKINKFEIKLYYQTVREKFVNMNKVM